MESNKNDKTIDKLHYQDDFVDAREISEFNLIVFTNWIGKTKAVSYDSNQFTPLDLVLAYADVAGEFLTDANLRKYKSHLIACGCKPEELEDANQ